MTAVAQLDDGLWRWTARHPEWHPSDDFGAEVASFALRAGRDTVLIDPLLPSGDGSPLSALDPIVAAGEALLVLITIPYHVRDAALVWRRWGGEHPVSILGHEAVARRLPADAPFTAIAPGQPLPHGIAAHAIGSPRRQETPLHLPGQRALAFGDAVVEADGALRVWIQREITDERARWYRDRLEPTLRPLAELDVDRILVTHGAPVLTGGRHALRAALEAGPWYHSPH